MSTGLILATCLTVIVSAVVAAVWLRREGDRRWAAAQRPQVRMWLVPHIADIAAPTVAELASGIDLAPFVMSFRATHGPASDHGDETAVRGREMRGDE